MDKSEPSLSFFTIVGLIRKEIICSLLTNYEIGIVKYSGRSFDTRTV